jgi:hypothetical protein
MSADAHARSLTDDLARLEKVFEAATRDLRRTLRETVDEQPAIALGAAAGIGFLLGGGLSRRALTVLFGVGTRMAGAWLQQEFSNAQTRRSNES